MSTLNISELSNYYQVIYYILTGVVGLCIGSFLNVLIYRLPNGMNIAKPASHCPNCGYQLKWYDNIPVLSYIILGGKCRNCKKHITFRYTIVELANMLLWLACAFLFKENLVYAICTMIICSLCICIFFIDLEKMIIMDRFQIMMLVMSILAIIFEKDAAVKYYGSFVWYDHLIGMLVSALFNFILVVVMNKILKRDSLGGGDFKFLIIAGLLLGWQRFILMMIFASVTASIYMLIKKAKTKKSLETPFAPFLTTGLIFALFFGYQIFIWYLNLVGVEK